MSVMSTSLRHHCPARRVVDKLLFDVSYVQEGCTYTVTTATRIIPVQSTSQLRQLYWTRSSSFIRESKQIANSAIRGNTNKIWKPKKLQRVLRHCNLFRLLGSTVTLHYTVFLLPNFVGISSYSAIRDLLGLPDER